MLIIYPDTNYDSFCSLADAEVILLNFTPTAQRTTWDITADTDKEILLRQSTLLIQQKVEQLPDTLETELKQSCAFLANHSIGVDMTNEDTSGNLKIKEIDGVIKKEWFSPNKDSNSLPDIVTQLLSKYDVSSSGAFSFTRS